MPSTRRTVIKQILAGTAAAGTAGALSAFAPGDSPPEQLALKGRINHSVCRWCYNDLTLDQLCAAAKSIGITGIDLVGPKDWGLSDEAGWANCELGLKPLLALAARHNVVLVMELLNSKIDHKDYQCDRTAWGATLAKRLGSEHFKLLYDIYHMQIDEGDVIRNLTDYHPYIAHYHTGGVPGRHEIDETQELYYPAIMRAILATGFKGYVAQEFIPKQPDKLASLRKAVQLCDV
jgi:hydroxypyruvate isomerase